MPETLLPTKDLTTKARNWEYFYALAAIGDIAGRIAGSVNLDLIFKPLLMIGLLLYFWNSIAGKLTNFSRFIIGALFFSWVGDIFLMLPFNQSTFFIFGLLSFLAAHLFYIFAYSIANQGFSNPTLFKQKPVYFLPFLLYLIGLYSLLFPALGDLAAPVLVYAVVLLGMGIFALNRYGKTNAMSFQYILVGAVLFIISDSCIALDKFVFQGQMPLGGVLVMLTYISGQYYIVKGAIAHLSRSEQ